MNATNARPPVRGTPAPRSLRRELAALLVLYGLALVVSVALASGCAPEREAALQRMPRPAVTPAPR